MDSIILDNTKAYSTRIMVWLLVEGNMAICKETCEGVPIGCEMESLSVFYLHTQQKPKNYGRFTYNVRQKKCKYELE